ncbi:hypothetical protein RchiOBHm_Chr2g0141291 [Rosa chinensis]|uniref:Uncharacterized protein n=1 Tax=Rosa chinensis TaxID=74649 RepID=A0A2P6RXM3_ROSCH|nr:hypothetical protein RchiOBHm_Chr2g0141291 [Rosa chinensis]
MKPRLIDDAAVISLPLITDAPSISLPLTPPHLAFHHDFGLEIEASLKQGCLAI